MMLRPPLLTRLRDWPERLDALLRAHACTPFTWGRHDCCTFAADAVRAVTGVDVMGSLRGQYSTAAGARRLTSELGGLNAAVTRLLGTPIAPTGATVGDVLLLAQDARELLAVCNGTAAIAPGRTGLQTIAAPQVLAAWRIA